MAPPKPTPLSKEDFRQLMRREQTKSAAQKDSRVAHPLAKYNSLQQLYCTACGTQVKSDIVWPAHLSTRSHKQALERMESMKQQELKRRLQPQPAPPPTKRGDEPAAKKAATAKSIAGLGAYSDSEEDEDSIAMPPPAPPVMPSQRPDIEEMEISSTIPQKKVLSLTNTMADVLPEGFFDDAVRDAEVREVVYVNKAEAEWADFQKEMSRVSAAADDMADQETEENLVDIDMAQVDEQLAEWTRVKRLQDAYDDRGTATTDATGSVLQPAGPAPKSPAVESDSDDDEICIDWRAKTL